ncbi:MAG: valine--tRNA ligase, partial [Actinobacteria bacterium]|nr:valine--tRNA ligase [Actinomycetota bacterium]
KVFPMDLRPQAHDIIRTWLFTTVVRSELEHGELPWRDVAVSGWVLDPDRKKMSKSKGNVVTPLPLVERHGPDAVRYWAAKGRPGTDTAVDEGQMKVGRRLAIKVLNASKFVLGQVHDDSTGGTRVVTEPLDASMLARLSDVVDGATAALDAYDYTRALDLTETFFWTFCDDYLELVKVRSYGGDADVAPEAVGSARAALEKALSVQLRLFAPFLPFVTEEIWSWFQLGSIHRARWPRASELTEDGSAPRGPRDLGSEALGSGEGSWDVYDVASSVLGEIRRTKSTEKRSMRARVSLVEVTDTQERITALETAAYDLVNAGNVAETAFRVGSPAKVNVTLEEVE